MPSLNEYLLARLIAQTDDADAIQKVLTDGRIFIADKAHKETPSPEGDRLLKAQALYDLYPKELGRKVIKSRKNDIPRLATLCDLYGYEKVAETMERYIGDVTRTNGLIKDLCRFCTNYDGIAAAYLEQPSFFPAIDQVGGNYQ